MNRRCPPAADRIAKPPDQLCPRTGHLLNRRGEQVIAIQRVEERAPGLLPVNEAVVDQPIEDVLNSGIGATCVTGQLTAAAWLGGAGQDDEHIGVNTGRKGCEGFCDIHRAVPLT
jgi:hypothetical protein